MILSSDGPSTREIPGAIPRTRGGRRTAYDRWELLAFNPIDAWHHSTAIRPGRGYSQRVQLPTMRSGGWSLQSRSLRGIREAMSPVAEQLDRQLRSLPADLASSVEQVVWDLLKVASATAAVQRSERRPR